MPPTILEVPAAEEGACLLHLSGLPVVAHDTHDALFFYYSKGTAEDGGLFERRSLAELNTAPVMTLPEEIFSETDPRIRIVQFTGCDESQAKALIAAKSEVLGPRDPRLTGVFDSLNLDRHEGFITGISLRALDRTQPHEGKLLTLLVSIPHLGLAANSYKAPAKPDEVSASRKTLQEYRFMRSKASQRTTDLDGIVCVHQTWFLLFDDETIGVFRSEDDELATRAPLFPFQERQGAVQALVNMLSNSITITEKTALKQLQRRVSELEWELWPKIEDERTKADKAVEAAAKATTAAKAAVTAAAKATEASKGAETETATAAAAAAVVKAGKAAEVAAAAAAAAADEKAAADALAERARVEIEHLTHSLELCMTDLSTILRLVRYQIQKLEELLRIIQNGSTPKSWNKHPRNWNPFEIGVFARSTEEMMEVQTALEEMIKEREGVLERINPLIQDLQGTLPRISHRDRTRSEGLAREQVGTQTRMLEKITSTETLLVQQGELAKKAQVALKKQGQKISVFTFITTIFLPLGFFCAYYAISPPNFQNTIHTQREFWTVSGPGTFIIALLMLPFLVGNDTIKKWLQDKWKAFCRRWWWKSTLPFYI